MSRRFLEPLHLRQKFRILAGHRLFDGLEDRWQVEFGDFLEIGVHVRVRVAQTALSAGRIALQKVVAGGGHLDESLVHLPLRPGGCPVPQGLPSLVRFEKAPFVE